MNTFHCDKCGLHLENVVGEVHHVCKPKKKKSRGLGDTIAKVTAATGIDKVVKAVVGKDCGCRGRQETLNKLVPYKE